MEGRIGMGSVIEINDTLKLRRGDGFPSRVEVNGVYSFRVPGRRLYHLQPVRVFLVEEVDGKWNYVGHAQILEHTVDAVRDETRGLYRVVSLYPPEHVQMMNKLDAPPGKGYVHPQGDRGEAD